jgi:hypothetical protein
MPEKKKKTAKKKKSGRKLKITEDMIDKFIGAIKVGAPIVSACGCAGISETTFYKWMQWADSERQDSETYALFREDIKRAQGEAAQRWLVIIEKAALGGSWQAAAWKLERKYPNEFGNRATLSMGTGSKPISIEYGTIDAKGSK